MVQKSQCLKIFNILGLVTVRICILNVSYPRPREMLQNPWVILRCTIGIYCEKDPLMQPSKWWKKTKGYPFQNLMKIVQKSQCLKIFNILELVPVRICIQIGWVLFMNLCMVLCHLENLDLCQNKHLSTTVATTTSNWNMQTLPTVS